MRDKRPLIVLTGPTAAGKSALSIRLAKHLGGEIISGDSMQVYRGMDIGTAKIKKDEMQGVPHHMIDILEPTESFDAFTFKEMAKAIVDDIYDRGRVPIVVGGTGFYIQALAYDVDFSEDTDLKLREKYERLKETKGSMHLYELLKGVDPDSAKIIDPNNTKRLIRALEFYETTGTPISQHNRQQRQKTSPYALKYFVLFRERQALYEDINRRVDIMMEEGLLEEVKHVYTIGIDESMTAYKALGYRELYAYFDGECSLEHAVDKIKQNTRHFAKRQLTWFRREKDVIWINRDKYPSEDAILNAMLEKINE